MENIEIIDNEKIYHYVYFIENHIDNENCKLKLSEDNNNIAWELKLELQNQYKQNNNIFIYSLYRFKIFIPKFNYKLNDIIIILENSKGYKFEGKITIKEFNKDIFIYNIKFEKNIGWLSSAEPPLSFNFDLFQQFEIYINYIRNLNFKQNSTKNNDLIISTQNCITGEDKMYTFSFYLSIFSECYKTNLIKRHLALFKMEKLSGIGKIEKEKLKKYINLFETIENNPETVLNNINYNKEEFKDYIIKLFLIILFFNYNYNYENIFDLLQNSNYKVYMYKALLDYNYFFQMLIIEKELIVNLIGISVNFSDLKVSLAYCNNLLDVIEIILENFDIFSRFCLKDIAKNLNPVINAEEIILINQKDNMEEISKKYIELIKLQIEKLNFIFFNIKSTLWDKYIKFFEEKNFSNYKSLFYIKEIKDFSKKINNKLLEIPSNNLDKIFHESGLALCNTFYFSNIELLKFIQKDEYNSSLPLSIFYILDIKSFDETFYLEWKKIKWQKIFDKGKYLQFLKLIADFIHDINDFGILFKLFDISNNNNQPDYEVNALITMKNKYIQLTKNCDFKNSTNFKEDLILLIYFFQMKQLNIKEILNNDLNKNLNDKINEILINFLLRYKDLISLNTKKSIVNFIVNNILNSDINDLIYIIKNYNDLDKNNNEINKEKNEKNYNNLEFVKLNKELNDEIKNLKKEIKEENNRKQNLKEKIKDLESIIKNGKEELKNNEKKILELNEIIQKKDEEIILLKEANLNILNRYYNPANLLSLIFLSENEDICYSLICKKNDKFSIIESQFYEKYPEYMELEGSFFCHNKKIQRFKTIEENNIKNNDIIYFHKNGNKNTIY